MKSKQGCDDCNYLYINGIGCHETGCRRANATSCETCESELLRHEVYYANDWDGIKLCRECATRQAEYEAGLEYEVSNE